MPGNESQPPKVFISYSWDDEEHKNNVLDLADSLREYGIDCHLDRFEISLAEKNQARLRQQMENSDYVIVVCTEEYNNSFQGKEKLTEESEITWKGFILNQVIYDRLSNKKFVPVIFSPEASKHIPSEFRKYNYYLLDNENLSLEDKEYQSLYQHLRNCLGQKELFATTDSLPSLNSYNLEPPIQDRIIQQKELTKSYRQIRNLSRTRSWNEVIAAFQQMQDNNLPYVDPNGYYKLACKELVKQEQQTRKLNSIYNQATRYYETKNWFKAQEKLEKVLSSPTLNKDLAIKTETRLNNIQKQLNKEKRVAKIYIVIGWLFSSLFPVIIKVLGGFISGIVIWYMSHKKRLLQPSQEVLRLFLFILIGIILEASIFAIVNKIFSFGNADLIANAIALGMGIVISIKLLDWQLDR